MLPGAITGFQYSTGRVMLGWVDPSELETASDEEAEDEEAEA